MDRSKPVSSIAVCIKPKATWWEELSHNFRTSALRGLSSSDTIQSYPIYPHPFQTFQIPSSNLQTTTSPLQKTRHQHQPEKAKKNSVRESLDAVVVWWAPYVQLEPHRLLLLNSSIPCGLVLQRVWPKLWVPRHQSANSQWIDFMLTSMLFPLFLHFFQPSRLSKGFPVVPKYTLARPDRPKAMPPAHCLSSFRNAESLTMGYPILSALFMRKSGC